MQDAARFDPIVLKASGFYGWKQHAPKKNLSHCVESCLLHLYKRLKINEA